MIDESRIPGSQTPLIDVSDQEIGHGVTSEKFQEITHRCIEILDQYTLLSLRPEEFEKAERILQENRKGKFGASAILEKFLTLMSDILQLESIDKDIRHWLYDELHALQETVNQKGKVELEDLKKAVYLLREFLTEQLYPGTTVQEIRQLIQEPAGKNESAKEEEILPPLDVEQEKQKLARLLYTIRFQWEYYPDVPGMLGLTGDKKKDKKIIETKEKELVDKYYKKNWEETFKEIHTRITAGEAASDEKLFLMLEWNKMRTQWFTHISHYVDFAIAQGASVEKEYEEAIKLEHDIERKRNPLTKKQREQIIKQGGRTSDVSLQAPVTEEDIKRGDAIIDSVLIALYPLIGQTDEHGTVSIDREELEKQLGIK